MPEYFLKSVFFSLILITAANSLKGQVVNLLNNGGFESGQSDWDGWNASVSISGDSPFEGSQCVRFTANTNLDQSIITLEPGKTYKMSVRLRINAMTGSDWGGIRFSVISYDWSTWYNSEAFSPQNRPVGQWFQEVIEFQPTQTQFRVQIGFFGGPGWVPDYSYDDISLYEQVYVNSPPVIDSVHISPLSGNIPFAVSGQIFATDPDGVVENYIADMGDGSSYSGNAAFTHTYYTEGQYKVLFAVVDDNGATDTLTQWIQATSNGNENIEITSPSLADTILIINAPNTNLAGMVNNGIGEVFWINNKTGQSGYVTPVNGLFQIPNVDLMPGLNTLHVQSAFSGDQFKKDELRIFYQPSGYVGPVVSNINPTKTQLSQYERTDIQFDLITLADNNYFPFDENTPGQINTGKGITIDMEFTNGTIIRKQPAFYFMESERNGNVLVPSGTFKWLVRMAFRETGTWTSRIIARDAAGETTWPGPVFTVMADSLAKGYLRVSDQDNRYFEYDNGDLFFGMGYGTSASGPNVVDTEIENWKNNSLNFGRFWLSSASPFSDSWSSWATHHTMANNGYMPPVLLTSQQKYGNGQFSWRVAAPAIDNVNTPAIFRGFWDGPIPVSANKTYRLIARVKTINITGTGGLVFKTGGWLGTDVVNAGTGTTVTPYMKGNNGWTYLTGTLQTNPGQNTLDYLYMVLENCTGEAFLDQLTLQELNADGSVKQNILSKWNANTHQYLDPLKSARADYLIDKAHKEDIHYKIVIHEKDDYISNHLDNAGFVTQTQGSFDQAPGSPLHKLYEYYWRNLMARWGYATSVHSWELVNEGAPASFPSLTNDLAGYAATGGAYPKMASTSFWSNWEPNYWKDSEASYGDIHAYIMTTGWIDTITIDGVLYDREALKNDAAAAVYAYSVSVGMDSLRNKPVVLGETDLDMPGNQSPDPLLALDTTGIWLHNFNWGHINHGGMTSLLWNSDNIRNHELYFRYRSFGHFIKNIPLQHGGYEKINAITSNNVLRVWGQQQGSGNAAHFWVQNRNHTWKNVLLNGNPAPESGTITLSGLTPGPMILERWNTWNEDTAASFLDTVVVASNGTLQISIVNLVEDLAFKLYNDNAIITLSADWSQYQRDAARTGRTDVTLPPPYRARWIWCSDTLTLRNQLSEPGWTDDLTSRNGYSFPLPDTAFVTVDQGVQPAVVGNRLYFATLQGKAYALNLFDGSTLWAADLPGGSVVSPAVMSNKVIFASIKGGVYAFDTLTGAPVWMYATRGAITTDPLVVANGVIIANHKGKVIRLAANGGLLWEQSLLYPIVGGIAANSLKVYVPAENMKVYALSMADGSVAGEKQLRGQSFRQTHPVLFNGKLWVTTCPVPMVGSEYILDDVLDDGASVAEEEANIRAWLNGNNNNGQWAYASPDWQHIFALDAETLDTSFLVGAGPVDGVGSPPQPVVIDNQDRVLHWFKTAFAYLTGQGPAFGTTHTLDISAIDPTNGNRIPIDNGQLAGIWFLETDNTYGLSVGGDYLWLRQRFRGVQCIHLNTSAWEIVQVPIRNNDGGSWNASHVCYTDVLLNDHYLQTPVVSLQQSFSKRTAPVLAGKYLILSESFGIVVIESYQP